MARKDVLNAKIVIYECSSEMVGELKCEFDVSSQCVTGEWSFTFTHDILKHLYYERENKSKKERMRKKSNHSNFLCVATITNKHFGTMRIHQMKTIFFYLNDSFHKLQ